MKRVRIIRISAIVLVVCLLLILVKNQYSSWLLTDSNFGMPPLIKKGHVDNLFIGTSMFRQGLDIDLLEENFEDSYILAYNGNQPYLEYLTLKKILDDGVTVNNLYVDMYAYSLFATPALSDDKLLLEMNMKEKYELFKLISEEDTAKIFVQMFVSSNNELLLTWPVSYPMINDTFKQGGTLNETVGKSKEEMDDLEIPSIGEEVNFVQLEYTVKLIELCRDNNINLSFIETPKYVKIASDNKYQSAMDAYAKLMDDNHVDYVRMVDIGFDNSNPSYYIDLIHLSSAGRSEFTKLLGRLY